MFQVFIGMASWVGLIRILAGFGDEVLAGYAVGIRLILFALLPSWGMSNAAATMVGQNLGAGRPDRAEAAVWRAGLYNMVFLGSIGVIAQIPNFNRLLKKHDIDFEMITAGEYKRTLTILGENTDKGREKFTAEIEDTHHLFKDFVGEHRPALDLDRVATGEHWFGQRALDLGLVDELSTSDEYIVKACETADVFEVRYVEKKPLPERIGIVAQNAADGLLMKWWERSTLSRYFS